MLAGRIRARWTRARVRTFLALSAAVLLRSSLFPRISAVRADRETFIGTDWYILRTYGDFEYIFASRVVRVLEPDAVVLKGWLSWTHTGNRPRPARNGWICGLWSCIRFIDRRGSLCSISNASMPN